MNKKIIKLEKKLTSLETKKKEINNTINNTKKSIKDLKEELNKKFLLSLNTNENLKKMMEIGIINEEEYENLKT